ncbi:MAG: hypothetical protein KDI98_06505 [Hyphomicrobiaceae bacterium]|nr:hypothetical protein [Hyphomicrobiaceae bacterium]
MTPTLLGRWQTRLLLFLVLGLPLTFLYAWIYAGFDVFDIDTNFFLVLVVLFVVGFILDPVYIWLQGFRWDHDWPFAFQFFFSFIEFGIVLALIYFDVLWFLPSFLLSDFDGFLVILGHFLTVFIPSFLALLGFIQIFLVRWRFKAAELGRL